jgi:O-antigen ligase/tetratricopeptide (TPR) repeat protein
MKKYLKLIIFGSIFALPFISFIVANNMFFPYIVGKNFVFRVLVELAFGAWVALMLIDAEYRPKISNVTIAISLFVLVIGIADLLGVNFQRSLWSNYERMDGYVTTFHAFLYFIVLSSVFRAQKEWNKLFHVMIATSIIMAFKSFNQASMPLFNGRADATMGNPIYLAVYMLFHIFITTYYLFREEIKNWRFKECFYISAIFIQIVSLYYTATRGTILGVVGGLFLAAGIVALFEKKQILLRKIAIWSVVGILILVGAFFVAKDSSFVRQNPVLVRFAGISIEDSSTKARLIVWGMAYQGFLERPVFGWGQENFPNVFNKYYDPEMYFAEPWYDRAHNVFMDWLVSAGIIGLLSYLLLFVAAIYTIWKKKENDFTIISKALFIGLLAGYFVHNILVFDNLTSYILFFTVLAYIHFRSTNEECSGNIFSRFCSTVSKPFKKESFDEDNQFIIVSIIGVATIAAMFMVNYAPYMQNKLIVDILRLEDSKVANGINIFKQALSYKAFGQDAFGTGEVRERLAIKANQIGNSQTIDQKVKDAYTSFAISEIEKQAEKVPGESKYLIMEASLYSNRGNFPKAIKVLEKALVISPKKEMILSSIGDCYLQMGNYKAALAAYKVGFDNAPTNKGIAKRYALAALNLGDEKLAESIIKPLFDGVFPIPDDLIMQFYERKGQIDVVIKTYEIAIQDPIESKVSSNRVSLTGVYLRMGKNDKAIEVLKQGIKDIPEDYKLRYTLISLYLQANNTNGAIGVLQQVLKDFPKNKYPDVYRTTQSYLQQLNDVKK